MDKIEQNLARIKAQIAPYNPIIVAVTKYFDEEQIIRYYKLGLRDFGENRVKDALEKIKKLPDEIRQNSRFHLIGHLQTNKVKLAVGNFELIHSVDSLKLAQAINEEAEKKGIIQKVLIQINNAHEEQKFGFSPEELKENFPKLLNLSSISIEGLMNIAPLIDDKEKLRELFRNIKQIHDVLRFELGVELKHISMGMSNDFLIALEEGATIIRLGRILFT